MKLNFEKLSEGAKLPTPSENGMMDIYSDEDTNAYAAFSKEISFGAKIDLDPKYEFIVNKPVSPYYLIEKIDMANGKIFIKILPMYKNGEFSNLVGYFKKGDKIAELKLVKKENIELPEVKEEVKKEEVKEEVKEEIKEEVVEEKKEEEINENNVPQVAEINFTSNDYSFTETNKKKKKH